MDNSSLRYFIETAPIAAAIFDTDMVCITSSPLWKQNYAASFKKGNSNNTIGSYLPFFSEEIIHKVLSGEIQKSDFDNYVAPDGSNYSIRWEFRPWLDEANLFKAAIIFVEDISDQKKAEQALLENADRFRLAQKVANIGIWDYDLSTGEAWLNDEFYSVYGLPTDFDFNYEAFLLMVHPEDKDYLVAAHQTELFKVGKVSADYRIIRVYDGKVRWISSTGEVLTNGSGEPHRVIGTVIDITDRKLIEKQLQDADQRKDEFIATLSHELRNPLNSTDLVLKALKNFNPKDISEVNFIKKSILKAEKNIQYISRLLEDLLDTSRISSGRFELRKTKCKLQEIFTNSIEANRDNLERNQIKINSNINGENIIIEVDDIRIQQVITNLIDNAIKYTHRGDTIELHVSRLESGLLISVKDHGIGIENDYINNIFDIFSRSHHVSGMSSGDGIGLALSRDIIELHGGTISAKSEGLGKGSEFVINLPNVIRV